MQGTLSNPTRYHTDASACSRSGRCYNDLLTRIAPRFAWPVGISAVEFGRRGRQQTEPVSLPRTVHQRRECPSRPSERNSCNVGGLAMYASAPSCKGQRPIYPGLDEVRISTGIPSNCFRLLTRFRISRPVTLGKFRSIMMTSGRCWTGRFGRAPGWLPRRRDSAICAGIPWERRVSSTRNTSGSLSSTMKIWAGLPGLAIDQLRPREAAQCRS